MKNLIIVFMLVCYYTTSAQSDKENIKKDINTYFDYVESNNSDGVINYMHPKVFETISKEQLKQGMDQMLKNEEMKIEFLSTEILNISNIISFENTSYSLIEYANDMQMTFLSEIKNSLEEKKIFIDFMKATMDSQFGEANVKTDIENAALIIHVESSIYAVYNKDFDSWKFLANDKNMTSVVNTIIPETVRNKIIIKE